MWVSESTRVKIIAYVYVWQSVYTIRELKRERTWTNVNVHKSKNTHRINETKIGWKWESETEMSRECSANSIGKLANISFFLIFFVLFFQLFFLAYAWVEFGSFQASFFFANLVWGISHLEILWFCLHFFHVFIWLYCDFCSFLFFFFCF